MNGAEAPMLNARIGLDSIPYSKTKSPPAAAIMMVTIQ